MRVELPCGLIRDGEVYDHVTVKELTGKQQNYLMNLELVMDSIGHIPKILGDLTEDFQTKEGKPSEIAPDKAVWMLPTEDIEYLLIKIREKTFGKMFAIQVVCPACDKQQTKSIDLSKLEIKKLKDKTKRSAKIKLPKSKINAEVRLMYLKDLHAVNEVARKYQDTFYTRIVALSIKKLGDKVEVTYEDLDKIPITDLRKIENAMTKLRGYVDNMLQHVCDGCKHKFEGPLPVVDPAFFGQSPTPSI